MNKGVREKGFTLVEVIVSIAIMGMLLMVLLTFMMGSFKVIYKQGNTTSILYSAQEELENAIKNPNYTVKNDQLFIERTPSSVMSNGSDIQGVVIAIKEKKDNKVILSCFIPENGEE